MSNGATWRKALTVRGAYLISIDIQKLQNVVGQQGLGNVPRSVIFQHVAVQRQVLERRVVFKCPRNVACPLLADPVGASRFKQRMHQERV
jgi:hypothetical protein